VTSTSDISNIFCRYISRQIKKIPFSEGPLQLESDTIRQILLKMNNNKLLTVNS